MKITEVSIQFVKPCDGLIGFASLVIHDNIYLSSIAIHKKLNSNGHRLTFPTRGQRCLFHPINKNASQAIEQAIFTKLKDVMNRVNDDRYSSFTNTIK